MIDTIVTLSNCTTYYISHIFSLSDISDMISIPNFVSGAMEHWGLITYRETNMLYDEYQASAANKQRVAAVVAHEIAHMVSVLFLLYKILDESQKYS